jgi:4-aminobutyrate aminotransferase
VIEDEGLCERANAIGRIILDRCSELKEKSNFKCIGDVRGLGAMCAIELVKDGDPHQPDAELTQRLMKTANANGLILLACGTYGNVIRFLAPLTASEEIVREGMDLFAKSLAEAVA